MSSPPPTTTVGDGPYFDDLTVGEDLAPAPAMTLTEAMAAQYAAISGDPFAPALSHPLANSIGAGPGLLNPALVLHASIGQSTVATRRVVANLFYRGVALRKQLLVGSTISTSVRIAGLRETTRKPGRVPRGLALLSITTTDEVGDVVADYQRCALVPFRADRADTGNHDELGEATTTFDPDAFAHCLPVAWALAPLGAADPWAVGERRVDAMADTVSSALELVRLTQNQAAVHRDVRLSPTGQRLVYGGHAIGLAQASLARLCPTMAYVLGWIGCDHVGPVYEGDLLSFAATLDDEHRVEGGRMLAITVDAWAHRDGDPAHVLQWRPVIYAP